MASNYDLIREENIREYGEGRRHLEILRRLYTDRTHFIFELLQNAEDARAKKIAFLLHPDRLEVWHDGREFNERDVRGICGVADGTKEDDYNQIGQFGIGFKSVYVYTTAPEIYTASESFAIEQYVRPHERPARTIPAGWTTIFVFPFNHPKISTTIAFGEIGRRLSNLPPRTLLFLRSLREIRWSAQGLGEGEYLQEIAMDTGCRRVTLLAQSGTVQADEEWLVFERIVRFPDLEKTLWVEVAFCVETDVKSGREVITPISDSKLVVYFPTNVETHLGFLIQGPYRTTPARDNIDDNDEDNQRLVQETASLIMSALSQLKTRGLMSVALLQTLPINPLNFPHASRLRPIFEKVRDGLNERALLPAAEGGYVTGAAARLGRGAELRELVTDAHLQQLLKSTEPLRWLSDEITQTKTPELYIYLNKELNIQEIAPETFARLFEDAFIEGQSDEWVARFYAFLNGQQALWRAERPAGPLREKPFLRLEDGSHVAPFRANGQPRAYLPPPGETRFPIVKRTIVTSRAALDFLRKLGLQEPDRVDEVITHVLPAYSGVELASSKILLQEHLLHIQQILFALEIDSSSRKQTLLDILRYRPLVRAVNVVTQRVTYETVSSIYLYLRRPDLELFFYGNRQIMFLDDCYGPYMERLRPHLLELGLREQIWISGWPEREPGIHLKSSYGKHERGLNGFDPGRTITGLDIALQNITYERAVYIWNELLRPNRQHIRGKWQSSNRKTFEYPTEEQGYSPMGALVAEAHWLPDRNNRFHPPFELSLADLPEEFERDEVLANQLGMRKSEVALLARSLDISMEVIDVAMHYPEEVVRLGQEKRQQEQRQAEQASPPPEGDVALPPVGPNDPMLNYASAWEAAFNQPGVQPDDDFYVRSGGVTNPAHRRAAIGAEITQARRDEPRAQVRFAFVPRKVWEGKDQVVRTFLLEEYRGHCQICTGSFLKRDGEPYFEQFALVSYTTARWIDRPGNALCLCAMCSAKFQHGAVEVEANLRDHVQSLRLRKEGGTGDVCIPVRLCGEQVAIRYSEKHLLDLQELLRSGEE